MIALAVLLVIGQVGGVAATIGPTTSRIDFASKVKAYVDFVTPRCALEEISPYRNFYRSRDSDFRQSLISTSLDEVYRIAVREQRAHDERIVYHCFGPPPPPPPPGVAVRAADRRALAIADAQKRLREVADEMPAVFDRGDALFAAMLTARDVVAAEGRH